MSRKIDRLFRNLRGFTNRAPCDICARRHYALCRITYHVVTRSPIALAIYDASTGVRYRLAIYDVVGLAV